MSSSNGEGQTDDGSSGSTTGDDASSDEDSTSSTGPLLDVFNQEESATQSTAEGGGDMGCEKVDLLFVIDDSASMAGEQDTLTAAFPSFMETINEQLVVDKDIDYRVGVTSAEMAGPDMCVFGLLCADGHRGRLQHQADRLNCEADEPEGRWINTGPVDDVSAEFTCVASMEGQDFREMPLEAARAALVDRVEDAEAYNAGFLREDALLVLVFLTDEDDQSVLFVPEMWPILDPFQPGPPAPVATYWQTFVDLKGGFPERVAAVAIAGPPNSDCGEDATDAPRLHEFLSLAEPNAYWADICGDDLVQPLQEALEVIEAGCEDFVPIP